MSRKTDKRAIPSLEELENERGRIDYNKRRRRIITGTIGLFVFVAAAALLIATLWVPVMRTYGNSMEPAISDGDILVVIKTGHYESGDILAFYYNNKIQIKRVIAKGGDIVTIDDNGYVSVNGARLREQYGSDLSGGECDIDFPFTVPDGELFVLGDNRFQSLDSRTKLIGCVTEEQTIGEVLLRIWPFESIGIPK